MKRQCSKCGRLYEDNKNETWCDECLKEFTQKTKHPDNCKGCPDCPGEYICKKCGKSFPELNTTHECTFSTGQGGKGK